MAAANVMEITDGNFKSEVLDSQTAVLVDFWAEWCMPCKILGKTIDELATEHAGKVKVGKVDTDKNQSVSVDLRITAIPTVILFHKGEVKKKFVGLTNKGDLRNALNELVTA